MTVETEPEKIRKTKSKKSAKQADAGTMNQEHHSEHRSKKNRADRLDDVEQKTVDTAESIEEKVKKTADDLTDEGKKAVDKTVKIAESELDRLKDELSEAKDRGLRALAELENFRQRKNRELADDRKYAAIDLARDILPVWDNMGRAIEAAEKNPDAESLIAGVKLMHQQFIDILKKHHIEKIEAVGKPFDPHFHESIAMLPSDEPAGQVIVDSQTGFLLHDRVVRPAQVVVAAPKPAPKNDA